MCLCVCVMLDVNPYLYNNEMMNDDEIILTQWDFITQSIPHK